MGSGRGGHEHPRRRSVLSAGRGGGRGVRRLWGRRNRDVTRKHEGPGFRDCRGVVAIGCGHEASGGTCPFLRGLGGIERKDVSSAKSKFSVIGSFQKAPFRQMKTNARVSTSVPAPQHPRGWLQ